MRNPPFLESENLVLRLYRQELSQEMLWRKDLKFLKLGRLRYVEGHAPMQLCKACKSRFAARGSRFCDLNIRRVYSGQLERKKRPACFYSPRIGSFVLYVLT